MAGFGIRTIWGLVVALIGAVVLLVLGGGMQAAAVAAVGGIAAVLVASDTGSHVAVPVPQSPPRSPPPILVGEVLDALVEPVLLIGAGRVTLANAAARMVLGDHIVGEDARIAIRHPAAADWLTRQDPDVPGRPIALAGIGTLDQRWEMRIALASDGQRIVHLVDQTGSDAAERMRVDFVANASHELRTPLASILGFIETLEDAGDDADIRTRFLKVMFDEARRMQRLVEDLISLSRIEATKYRLPDVPVDLAGLIAQVCAEMVDSGDPRAADVRCEADGDVPPIAGDRAQLSQMLHNLIGNAMKYGRPETPVDVRLSRDGAGMIRLSVADEGDGIPAAHVPRLTERFYRVDAGRSRTLGGTGLGLAIVKHIVERHRGRLEIGSRVGVGTTVSVLLPPRASMSQKGNENVTQPHMTDANGMGHTER